MDTTKTKTRGKTIETSKPKQPKKGKKIPMRKTKTRRRQKGLLFKPNQIGKVIPTRHYIHQADYLHNILRSDDFEIPVKSVQKTLNFYTSMAGSILGAVTGASKLTSLTMKAIYDKHGMTNLLPRYEEVDENGRRNRVEWEDLERKYHEQNMEQHARRHGGGSEGWMARIPDNLSVPDRALDTISRAARQSELHHYMSDHGVSPTSQLGKDLRSSVQSPVASEASQDTTRGQLATPIRPIRKPIRRTPSPPRARPPSAPRSKPPPLEPQTPAGPAPKQKRTKTALKKEIGGGGVEMLETESGVPYIDLSSIEKQVGALEKDLEKYLGIGKEVSGAKSSKEIDMIEGLVKAMEQRLDASAAKLRKESPTRYKQIKADLQRSTTRVKKMIKESKSALKQRLDQERRLGKPSKLKLGGDDEKAEAPVERVRRKGGRPTKNKALEIKNRSSELSKIMSGIVGGTTYPRKLAKAGFTVADFESINPKDSKGLNAFVTKIQSRAKIRPTTKKIKRMIEQAREKS